MTINPYELVLQFPEYRGMSYEKASREADRLLKRGGWLINLDRLIALRWVMDQERDRMKFYQWLGGNPRTSLSY